MVDCKLVIIINHISYHLTKQANDSFLLNFSRSVDLIFIIKSQNHKITINNINFSVKFYNPNN